jgi:hypothetical protein
MSFAAKYNTWCPACSTRIRVGDECDYSGARVVHEGCGTPTRPVNDWAPNDTDDDDEPEPVVTGRRIHERRCGDCHTFHAGECW